MNVLLPDLISVVLVINNKFICAALRTPASVVGDGINNIQWLIDETNKDPRRGFGHEKVLTQITVDQFTQKMLDDVGLYVGNHSGKR